MINIRPSTARGHANHGWLDSYHSFSFGSYFDRNNMGFRGLRVINEDHIEPSGGFPTHPHNDMEIITYVTEGALEHKDSMGNGSVMRRGDIQRMSAGSGITHSEFNHSDTEPVHLLQIWVLTETNGIAPSYEQKSYVDSAQPNTLQLIAARGGDANAVHVNQDVKLFRSELEQGNSISVAADENRHYWLQVVDGELSINDRKLTAGDGAAVSNEKTLTIIADNHSEFLLFDLA